MNITNGTWDKYIKTLHKLNEGAAKDVESYMKALRDRTIAGEMTSGEAANALIDYAYAVATKYSEGSAAAACEMYDAVAQLSGETVPPAVPAETPSYNDVAKAVNGTRRMDPSVTANAISRLVKRTGVDTTLNNALRDGAEWAWIPRGDTCAFCLTLASRGWQRASEKALKNGHADHIHAHCDCTYAVRFDDKTNVEGYDPDALLKQYYAAEGDTPEERINSLRRASYAKNKDRINAQKRAAYTKRTNNAGNKITANRMELTRQAEKRVRFAGPGVGSIEYESGFVDKRGEEAMAKWLHETFGGDILLLAENNVDGELNPDYLWMGRYWDLKSPTSSNFNTIENRVKHGLKQIAKNPGGIIVDITKSPANIELVEEVIRKVAPSRIKETTGFIIKDGDSFKVIRI